MNNLRDDNANDAIKENYFNSQARLLSTSSERCPKDACQECEGSMLQRETGEHLIHS